LVIKLKEVNMKKFVCVVMLLAMLCSLPAFAKATYDFETAGEEDKIVLEESYFTISERSSDEASSGDYSVKIVIDDTSASGSGGAKWTFRVAGYDGDPILQDITSKDDTFFVYLYLPDVGTGVMDYLQPYIQADDWGWISTYHGWDGLPKDQWDCYWVAFEDTNNNGSSITLPYKKLGVEFGSIESEPACTIYVDYLSTEQRGTSGIELITDPAKVTIESSINSIKFSMNESTPVLVSVYNLMGAKVAEKAPGGMAAGSHEISVDLPNGMYIVKLVAGHVKKTGKLLMIK
jgi:hypothetical protein